MAKKVMRTRINKTTNKTLRIVIVNDKANHNPDLLRLKVKNGILGIPRSQFEFLNSLAKMFISL